MISGSSGSCSGNSGIGNGSSIGSSSGISSSSCFSSIISSWVASLEGISSGSRFVTDLIAINEAINNTTKANVKVILLFSIFIRLLFIKKREGWNLLFIY